MSSRTLLPPTGGRMLQPVCSFCGRDLWEAAHYVRGEVGAICDECIAAAQTALAAAHADQHALFLPVRIYGTEPESGAADAILDAVRDTFGATNANEMIACVENGAALSEATAHFLARRASELPPPVVRVDRIRFSDDDLAFVRITQLEGEVAADSFDIRVPRIDERWLISADSFMRVLEAIARRSL